VLNERKHITDILTKEILDDSAADWVFASKGVVQLAYQSGTSKTPRDVIQTYNCTCSHTHNWWYNNQYFMRFQEPVTGGLKLNHNLYFVWKFQSSGMWWCAAECIVPDNLKKGQSVFEMSGNTQQQSVISLKSWLFSNPTISTRNLVRYGLLYVNTKTVKTAAMRIQKITMQFSKFLQTI
jgi:hypothetical protein